MIRYLYNPPKLVKAVFNKFAWESSQEKILITFDDGPNPGTTERILASLKKHNVQALFFLVGENIKRYPEFVKQILDEGHEIGNHTMKHSIISKLSKSERQKEIDEVQKIMHDEFDYIVKYFRPPHGRFSLGLSAELEGLKLRNVMWSLLTYDFKNNLDIVKNVVNNYLNKNSLVVFHDSKKSENIIIDSIEYLLAEVERKNLKVGNVSECLS